MPTVPRLSVPQVQEAGLPNVRQAPTPDANALGGGQAAAANFGAVEDAFLKIKQDADKTAIVDAQNRLAEWKIKKLYDQKEGLLNRKGKNALSIPDEAFTDFDTTTSEIEGTLSGRTQVAAFKNLSADYKNDLNSVIQRHVSSEMDKYTDEQYQKSFELTYEEAAKNFGDQALLEKSVAKQKNLLAEFGQIKGHGGVDSDWYKVESTKMTSRTYKGVIESVIASGSSGSDAIAQAYFDKYKDGMTADDAADLKSKLEGATLLGQSYRNADAIFAKYKNTPNAGYAVAAQIKDDKVRDATEKRLDTQFSRYKTDKDRSRDLLVSSLWDLARKNKSVNVPEIQSAWGSLSISEKKELEKASKDDPIETDWNLLSYYKVLSTNPKTREQFREDNKLWSPDVKNRLPEKEWNELIDIQTKLRGKDRNVNKYLDSIHVEEAQITSDLIKSGKNTPEDRAKFDREYQAIIYNAEQSQGGKPLTYQQKIDVKDKLMTQGVVEKRSILSDRKKRLYELDSTSLQFVVPYENIPPRQREAIKKQLQQDRNNPITNPTKEDILKAYNLQTTKEGLLGR